MPATDVVLFTRDLRVHDHPALHAGAQADRVVPLFVLDDAILSSGRAAPNRLAFLLAALADLRQALRERGGDLIVRRGDVATTVARVLREVGAARCHVTRDVSAYARRRQARLSDVCADAGVELVEHPGHLLVEPGAVVPSGGGDHFKVFTPYWRRWRDQPFRDPLPSPARIRLPGGLDPGLLPDLAELADGAVSPDLELGGEPAARARLAAWLGGGIDDYPDRRGRLADTDGTSRLSAHLHLGTLSVADVAARLDLRRRGHEPFLQQLCWREFNHQLLAANPDLPQVDYRPRGDRWRDDDDAFAAWCEGRTGYPVVDAGMRQLRREGWMHNRARMITASFLTKHLYVDWRRGAEEFERWLVDGDLANNRGQWQWVAGTGTDSRPNRVFNPVTQGRRHDPGGDYVRRYVPELTDLDDRTIHAPWEAETTLLEVDYPAPLVEHDEARRRFLEERGAG